MKLKKSLFCAAIYTFGVTAHAQSSVTLYGILDEGLMYSSNVNGGKRVYMDALGGIHGSRWGFVGKEDLGGGLQAIFQLESGINLNNGAFGQGGTAFGRQAYVGLNSQQYGSLTFGRQYDMIFYFPEALTAAGLIGSVVFGHPGDLDNTANSVRLNNAIRYMSPKLGGFSFGGEYSVGGVPGNTTANSGYSVGAGYSYGPIQLGAAFEYFKNPTSSTPGSGFFTAYANGVSLLSQALNKGYASASAYQLAVVAGTYTIGQTTLIASASNVQYANLGGTLQGGTARFNNVDVGAQYKLSPAFILSAEYEYLIGKGVHTTTGSVVGNQHFHQIAAMADYLFSKRTDVYLEGGWQRASGTSSIGTPAVADFTNQGDSSNNHQFLARLALRHKF
ncbi:putative porin [Burkholderia sp. OAS925]|uniref:porin n=1 Tax=Paraburkholderia TaxID=1822464 RepID=UPI00178A4CEA|nr:porin [Paraburkholderia graminis]MDR6475767.1 putative porin [Paraburkholderia graminis]